MSSLKLALCLFLCTIVAASAQLTSNFYATSCPNALSTIKAAVNSAISSESRMGASLLRLHFHDCFVNGCDGSILLDDNSTSAFVGEKTAGPNANSARGFDVIDTIKSKVEALCPKVVSCADIVAVAARDSVLALGGTGWTVPLGRRDATTASLSTANSDLPGPTSNLGALISSFSNKGFTTKEMVALSGLNMMQDHTQSGKRDAQHNRASEMHNTIGQARCTTFRTRLYNENNIDASFAASLKTSCPSSGSDNSLSPLDLQTPNKFDNVYYKNLLNNKGLLHSDQELFNTGSTNAQVTAYSSNPSSFATDFANAMVKMSNLSPLTGTQGEIRINCRKAN